VEETWRKGRKVEVTWSVDQVIEGSGQPDWVEGMRRGMIGVFTEDEWTGRETGFQDEHVYMGVIRGGGHRQSL